MPGADEINAMGQLNPWYFIVLIGGVFLLILSYLFLKFGLPAIKKRNGASPPKKEAAVFPNGFAAMKEDIGELKNWTIEHTKKFDEFVIRTITEDTLHTERLNTLKERIEKVEEAGGN